MSDSPKQIAEAIQSYAYRKCGRDPKLIPEELEITKYRPRPPAFTHFADNAQDEIRKTSGREEILDAEYRIHMDNLYTEFQTTKFQDPVILAGMIRNYKDLFASARTIFPNLEKNILVATAPISQINGFAFQAKNGKSGIILQEGNRFKPRMLIAEILDIILPKDDYPRLNLDRSTILEKLKNSDFSMNFTNRMLIDFTKGGSAPLPTEPQLARYFGTNATSVIAYNFYDGFMDFVFSHEISHVGHNHVNVFQREENINRNSYSKQIVQETITKYTVDFLSEDFGAALDKKNGQLFRFLTLQPMEHEADLSAMKVLLVKWHSRRKVNGSELDKQFEYSELCVTFLGVVTFFWYAEISERLSRTITEGLDWTSNKIFTEEFHVQGLVHRDSHPAPLLRLNTIDNVMQNTPPQIKATWRLALESISCLIAEYWRSDRLMIFQLIKAAELKMDRGDEIDDYDFCSAIGLDRI